MCRILWDHNKILQQVGIVGLMHLLIIMLGKDQVVSAASLRQSPWSKRGQGGSLEREDLGNGLSSSEGKALGAVSTGRWCKLQVMLSSLIVRLDFCSQILNHDSEACFLRLFLLWKEDGVIDGEGVSGEVVIEQGWAK